VTDTRSILSRLDEGDPTAAAELLPVLYEELRRLAADRMRRAPAQSTLRIEFEKRLAELEAAR